MSIVVAVVSFLLIRGTPESKEPLRRQRRSFDWLGLIAFIIAMVALNVVIGQGASLGWTSATVLTLIAVFVFATIIFFRVELSVANSFVDLTLFKDKTFTGATLSNFLLNGAAGTLIVALALVQQAAGLSTSAIRLAHGRLSGCRPQHHPRRRKIAAENGCAEADALRLSHHGVRHPADMLHLLARTDISGRCVHRLHPFRHRPRLLRNAINRRRTVECSAGQSRFRLGSLQNGFLAWCSVGSSNFRGAIQRAERLDFASAALRALPRQNGQCHDAFRRRSRAALQCCLSRHRSNRRRDHRAEGRSERNESLTSNRDLSC